MAEIVNHPFKFEVERQNGLADFIKLMIFNALINLC